MTTTVLCGDCRKVLPTLAAGSVQCCVSSPPYFGLRDYGHARQIGLEQTPEAYVSEMVAVFREVRRVLRDDGTLWLNIGDSYSGNGTLGRNDAGRNLTGGGGNKAGSGNPGAQGSIARGGKPKDLLMIPAQVALALRADGWFLRSDIIWHKPNPMPESATDRPTSAHEHVFLLTKSSRYFYDATAIAEAATSYGRQHSSSIQPPKMRALQESGIGHCGKGGSLSINYERSTRNVRNVWTIAPRPYRGAHFAVMPQDLVERCIKAGSKPGDMTLDPFGGAGTVGLVADSLGRNATLIELNPAYAKLARARIAGASVTSPALARTHAVSPRVAA